ncbi:MAG: glycosyltransferase family 4 protein [Bacteroidales bacterium]|nr:glycosyltransferase family 4 protein [Bacteroidales bacterium]
MHKGDILLIGNYYPTHGGISALIRNLKEGLMLEGYKVHIFPLGKKRGLVRLINYLKLPFVISKYPIIHAHGCSSLGQIPIISSYFISKILRKKFIVTFHGAVNNASTVANNVFFKKIMSKTVTITTPSEITANIFSDVGYNTVSIPNILEKDLWLFRKRNVIGPKMICTRSKYNPKLVIDTFNGVKKVYPNASLIMLGNFQDDKMRQYAKQFNSISLIGNVPRDEVYKHLNASDIYINSCNNDSFGYSIYEALSAGLAVVSIESPELLANIGNDIITFSSNTETMEESISTLIKNQNKTIERISKGYNLYSLGTWDYLKSKWENVYKDIIPL